MKPNDFAALLHQVKQHEPRDQSLRLLHGQWRINKSSRDTMHYPTQKKRFCNSDQSVLCPSYYGAEHSMFVLFKLTYSAT